MRLARIGPSWGISCATGTYAQAAERHDTMRRDSLEAVVRPNRFETLERSGVRSAAITMLLDSSRCMPRVCVCP